MQNNEKVQYNIKQRNSMWYSTWAETGKQKELGEDGKVVAGILKDGGRERIDVNNLSYVLLVLLLLVFTWPTKMMWHMASHK